MGAQAESGVTINLVCGSGSTVMVNDFGGPLQVTPAFVNKGVTAMVPSIGAEVVLVALNGAIVPVPLAPNPIAVLLLVQV
jgi:hypothetical protein